MITIDEQSLAIYSNVCLFLNKNNDFNDIVLKDTFNTKYAVTLHEVKKGLPLKVLHEQFTLVEICVALSLDKHLAFLAELEGFKVYLQEKTQVFNLIVENGALELFKQLTEGLGEQEIIKIIFSNSNDLVKLAIEKEQPNLLRYFIDEISNETGINLLLTEYAKTFFLVVFSIDLLQLKQLCQGVSKSEFIKVIRHYNFEMYQKAVMEDELELVEYFDSYLSDDEVVSIIKSQNYTVFCLACVKGSLRMLEHFERKLSDITSSAEVQGKSFDKFCLVAENNNVEMIKAIESKNFKSFRLASQYGHLHILEYLVSKISQQSVIKAIETRAFEAYKMAAHNGHLTILKYFENLCLEFGVNLIHAIKPNEQASFNYDSFRLEAFNFASSSGNIELLDYIESKLLDEELSVLLAITSYDYEAFRLAAEKGYLEVLHHFEAKLVEGNLDITEAIKAQSFYAYRYAAANGHITVLNYFDSKLSLEQKKQALESHNYYPFFYAIRNGHVEMLTHLERQLETIDVEPVTLMHNDKFRAFRCIARKGLIEMVDYCLLWPMVLAYAECREEEYIKLCVNSFISDQLNKIRLRKTAFEAQKDKELFDVEHNEAPLYFYIIRNLIRSNKASSILDIELLVGIGSIKELLHQNLSGDGENELLRLALRNDNERAVYILISAEDVLKVAEVNNYYDTAWGPYGTLNLKNMISDKSLSTQVISDNEQRMIDLFKEKHEEDVRQKGGIISVVKEIQPLIIERYNNEPIRVDTSKNKNIILPHEPSEYQKLIDLYESDSEFRTVSIDAYYKHPVHSLLRCLFKDDFWLKEKNKTMPDGKIYTEHWTTKEEYLPTIAYLYLAAIDRKKGQELEEASEQRTTLFIKLFASLCAMEYSSSIGN